MAQTQFFKRENSQLDQYKKDFRITLEKVKIIKLFPEDVIVFFEKWIDAIESYIARDDVDNFWLHLYKIIKEEECYEYIKDELEKVTDNWKIQEYSFNMLTQLDESIKMFSSYQVQKIVERNLEQQKNESKKQDEEKMRELLWEIEDM